MATRSPWFTAIGNVEFALKRLQLPKSERRDRAMEALREVGIPKRRIHAERFAFDSEMLPPEFRKPVVGR